MNATVLSDFLLDQSHTLSSQSKRHNLMPKTHLKQTSNMLTTTNIDNIFALFNTKAEHMPKISANGERLTYTTLRKFQDALNVNERTVPYLTGIYSPIRRHS